MDQTHEVENQGRDEPRTRDEPGQDEDQTKTNLGGHDGHDETTWTEGCSGNDSGFGRKNSDQKRIQKRI